MIKPYAPSKRTQHCNKVTYPSIKAAMGGLNSTVKSKAKKNDPIVSYLRAYKCQYCPGYHVGRVKGQIMWDVIAQRDEALKKLRENAK